MKPGKLVRHTPLRSGTGVKPVNQARQKKRRQSYAKKLAAYRASVTFEIVNARAAGRCEMVNAVALGFPYEPGKRIVWRCFAREGLQHHHKTYARFGGKELPSDIIVLCKHHHALAEAEFPHRRNKHRRVNGDYVAVNTYP